MTHSTKNLKPLRFQRNILMKCLIQNTQIIFLQKILTALEINIATTNLKI